MAQFNRWPIQTRFVRVLAENFGSRPRKLLCLTYARKMSNNRKQYNNISEMHINICKYL